MAVAFREITVAASPAGGQYSTTAPAMTTVQEGDLLVAGWFGGYDGNIPVFPPGFQPIMQQVSDVYVTAMLAVRYAVPSEGSFAFSSAGSGYGASETPFVAAYSGVAAVGAVADVAVPAVKVDDSMDWPSITAPTANGMRVLIVGMNNPSSLPTVTDPSGYTLRGSGNRLRVYDKAISATGATGATSAALTVDAHIAAVALQLTGTTVAPKSIVAPVLTGTPYNGQDLVLTAPVMTGDGDQVVVWKRDGAAI